MTTLVPAHSNIAGIATQRWHDEVREMLDFLPVLYPGGSEWLERRLCQVDDGTAVVHAVRADGGQLAGVMLGVLKPSGRFKISTLFVREEYRRRGVGGALLDAALVHARVRGAKETYITGATSIRAELAPLLASRSFTRVATEISRYGEGRDEDVFVRSR